MYNIVDLTHLKWGTTKAGGGSYGCYMKSSEIINGKKIYYKLSNYNSSMGFIGDESAYEVIASRLLRKLGFNVVEYKLIKARVKIYGKEYITFACKSEDFSTIYDSRLSFEQLRELNMQLTVDDVINKYKLSADIKKMIVADFLIIGRDRHGKNIEVGIKNGKYELISLFDNGLSFTCFILQDDEKYKQKLLKFDPLEDYRVNNYIGKQSLYYNLRYINKPVKVHRLNKNDRRALFYNMAEVFTNEYLDKIWEIICYRYWFLRKRGLIVEV